MNIVVNDFSVNELLSAIYWQQIKYKVSEIRFSEKIKYKEIPKELVNLFRVGHFILFFFFNWDSLYARLNSHYKAWTYKEKKHKKIKTYRKSV